MKICFMGTPLFAVPALLRLAESRHEVALVVTQPSKPKGRSGEPVDPPVKVEAMRLGIPVLQPASLKKEPVDAQIRERGIDLGIVVAYGKLLPDPLLEAPRLGCINIHASMLPEYRGAAPIQRAIIDGRMETGVTIMKVVTELDAGPIIAQEPVEISDDDDALSLSGLLSVVGADLLMRVLDDIEKEDAIEGIEQDASLVTYAPIITKSEGMIPWKASGTEIMCKLRGLTPWPGLFTTLGGKRLKVIRAEPVDSEEAEHHGAQSDLRAGSVSGFMEGFGFLVKTGDGHLLLREVQLEGKAAMEAMTFLRGNPLKIGTRLGVESGDFD